MKLNSRQIERKVKYTKVFSYDCVESTNKTAKELALNGSGEKTIVVSTQQTGGKGRLGRTFFSPKGGVYLSVILRPEMQEDGVLFITVAAAVAAARAIEAISGKKCEIKWVNDIYIDGKKVCGILTEGEFNSDGGLNYAVLGVGINLFAPKGDFPSNLPLADSVFSKRDKILLKKRVKEQLVAEFVNAFFEYYENLDQKSFMQAYKDKSFLTGKEITYTKGEKTYSGIVVGIDDNARLIVNFDGREVALLHGEIQIIGMEQPAV